MTNLSDEEINNVSGGGLGELFSTAVSIAKEIASTYIVQSSDTAESIAQQFGITVKELAEANPNLNLGQLWVNSPINIPKK